MLGSYKKIEEKVIDSYQTSKDKFVNTFFKKYNEPIEEAKEKIKKEIYEKYCK